MKTPLRWLSLITCAACGAPEDLDSNLRAPDTYGEQESRSSIPTVIWVSPNGSSTGNGATRATAVSVTRALALVDVTNNQPLMGDLQVRFTGGTYFLGRTLAIGPQHSGNNGYKVVFRNAPGEAPVLSGGRLLDVTWERVSQNEWIWRADLPAGLQTYRQIYIGGRRHRVAASDHETPTGWGLATFGCTVPSDPESCYLEFPTTGRGYRRSLPARAEVEFVDKWYNKIYELDLSRSSLITETVGGAAVTRYRAFPKRGAASGDSANPRLFGFFVPGSSIRARYRNTGDMLTNNGLEFVGDTARLLVVPPAAVNPNVEPVIVPQLDTIVRIEGTATARVNDVELYGLTLAHSRFDPLQGPTDGMDFYNHYLGPMYTVTPGGLTEHRPIPGAVEIAHAQNIDVRECDFTQLGGSGLELRESVVGARVLRNHFRFLSGSAINVSTFVARTTFARLGSTLPTLKAKRARRVVIKHNWVRNVGLDYFGSPGIFIPAGQEIVVARNRISRVGYSGIFVSWGLNAVGVLGDSVTGAIYVLNNEIDEAMNTVVDGGAVYNAGGFGKDESGRGTFITGNYAHDMPRSPLSITATPVVGWYLDQGSGNVTVARNLSRKVEQERLVSDDGERRFLNSVFENRYSINETTRRVFDNRVFDSNPASDRGQIDQALAARTGPVFGDLGYQVPTGYLLTQEIAVTAGLAGGSSSTQPLGDPQNALDGTPATAWFSDRTDPEPTLSVKWLRSEPVVSVRISPQRDGQGNSPGLPHIQVRAAGSGALLYDSKAPISGAAATTIPLSGTPLLGIEIRSLGGRLIIGDVSVSARR